MTEQTPDQLILVLEAALLTAVEPLSFGEMKKLLGDEWTNEQIRILLIQLQQDWAGKSVELVQLASGWRFKTKAEFQPWLNRLNRETPAKYSRATLETLAIIVYRQPVTRSEIEEIRGVGVSGSIIHTLMARGWIETVGHRDVPGRPALLATTKKFLDDLNLRSLNELPPLTELVQVLSQESLPNV